MIKVLVSGACGRMGQAVVKAVMEDQELQLVAAVDIKTGSKTILDYLLKPLNKAKEALRER